MLLAVAVKTGTMMIVNWEQRSLLETYKEKYLSNIIFYLGKDTPLPLPEILNKSRLIEIADNDKTEGRIKEIKAVNPELVVAVRVELDSHGEQRSIELAHNPIIEVIHIVSDINGNQIGVEKP